MSLAHEDVVQEVPVFGAWVLPVPTESGILLEQEIDDYQSLPAHSSESMHPLVLQMPTAWHPRTPGHTV